MKFKSQDKQNQLIENSSSSHLVVGVDIAQGTHVARTFSFRGIALGQSLEFGSHGEGFEMFDHWIQGFFKSQKLCKVIVGMELPVTTGLV